MSDSSRYQVKTTEGTTFPFIGDRVYHTTIKDLQTGKTCSHGGYDREQVLEKTWEKVRNDRD